MSSVSYIELGGTLFIPASHKHLNAVVNEGKYKELKSLVIDFEDGLDEACLVDAMKNIESVLANINSKTPFVFLRARDTKHLKELLALKSINSITGFVLAKFSLVNADAYLELLEKTNHLLMPSIEGK